jgi:hypothetical protein
MRRPNLSILPLLISVLFLFSAAETAFSANLTREILAKAPPDECFDGIGNPYPPFTPTPPNYCQSGGIPKVNQAYVWGLTKNGTKLWFGTVANTHCLVMSTSLGLTVPSETGSWVCEFGESEYRNTYSPPLPGIIGDFRPPKMYSYDTVTKTLVDKTPVSGLGGTLVKATSGIRSAGTSGNLVFLAGPSLAPIPLEPGNGRRGINMFAFNATTGALIGIKNFPEYSDIRQWVTRNGILYTGVRNSAGGGSILRWTGTLASPFQFQVVGNLDTEAAYLAFHENRLFVTTWPSATALAGLYMSPVIPSSGLTSAHASSWKKVWEADDYDPDPLTAATYGGGALASYGGYLYWGTMHVPGFATEAALIAHENGIIDLDANGNGSLDGDEILNVFWGTYRSISIFSGRYFGTSSQQLRLLYGENYLSTYDPVQKQYTTGYDAAHRNRMPSSFIPLKLGSSGFGNFFNVYTWSMNVYDNKLYIGTFDWSYLLYEGALDAISGGSISEESGSALMETLMAIPHSFGADLYYFMLPGLPAQPESTDGLGNHSNYGLRTMLVDDALYVGTANPMNLLTNPTDGKPEGGWELLKLKKKTR